MDMPFVDLIHYQYIVPGEVRIRLQLPQEKAWGEREEEERGEEGEEWERGGEKEDEGGMRERGGEKK